MRYAEKLKKEFGRALVNSSDKNKVVKIPGVNGMPHKEISFVHLAGIIQARMEEIIEQVIYQLDSNGLRNYLGTGIVVTGGGASLKTLPQLMSYKTGQMTRIGKPRVAMIGETTHDVHDPSLATAIGLIMEGYDDMNQRKKNNKEEVLFEFQKESPAMKKEAKKEESTENTEASDKDKSSKGNKGFTGKMKTLFDGWFDINDTQM